MGDFEKYDKLVKVEFLEFIGRWAYLTYHNSSLPFIQKVKSLLEIILPIVGAKLHQVSKNNDVASESDYDDDYMEDCMEELLNGNIR